MANLLKQFEDYFTRFQESFGSVYVAETEVVVAAAKNDDEFAYPLLHLEIPTIKTIGIRDNSNVRYKGLGFVIVKLDDYESRNEALRAAMGLIQLLIDRMREDAYDHEDLTDFNYDVDMEAIRPLWNDNAIGWEFNFVIVMPS